ncbi:MerR family DNA-binding transcriptional regulator [Treponema parvum]
MGTTPSALRYYEKEGLLPFVKRASSGKRVRSKRFPD